jgi:hypothetical protein
MQCNVAALHVHLCALQYPAGERGLRARLQNVVEHDFAQITYTEAVALLQVRRG